jgi:hypothetical protein
MSRYKFVPNSDVAAQFNVVAGEYYGDTPTSAIVQVVGADYFRENVGATDYFGKGKTAADVLVCANGTYQADGKLLSFSSIGTIYKI